MNYFRFIVLVLFLSGNIYANNSYVKSNTNSVDKSNSRLKLFVEGDIPDFNYIRNHFEIVDFVNEPLDADVHVIVVQRTNGGGGDDYIFTFYSNYFAKIGNFSLSSTVVPNTSPEKKRQIILRSLVSGLMPYINQTPDAENVDFSQIVKRNTATIPSKQPTLDNWNNWVFRLDFGGSFDFEEKEQRYTYNSEINADRITEKWRIRNNAEYNRSFLSKIAMKSDGSGDTTLIVNKEFQNFSSRIVYSLSEHWSAGIFSNYFRSDYYNTDFSIAFKPAIEYNFFNWSESDKNIFTIAYFISPEFRKFQQQNRLFMEDMFLWEHNIEANLRVIKKWGELNTRIEAEQYLNYPDFYSILMNTNLSFRLTRGLSLRLNMNAKSIYNQIYLPAKNVSYEDQILGAQKLPTSFEISGSIGLRFYFGSIYNNIVNLRL